MSKASQSCMKRAALSEPSLSIAPARWTGLLAMTPIGRPSMRMRAVTMPMPKSRRSSRTEPVVGERLDDLADVVDAQAVLGDDAGAVARWSGASHVATAPGSRRGTSSRPRPLRPRLRRRRRRPRLAPGRPCGPISSGAKTPRPPPSIIAGPPMPMLRVRGGDDDVAAAQQRGVAGEAAAGNDADHAARGRESWAKRAKVARRGRRRRCRRCRRAGRRHLRRRARPACRPARRCRCMRSVLRWFWRPACRRRPCSRRP